MIQEFVDTFIGAKSDTKAALKLAHPEGYDDLVKRVILLLGAAGEDWNRQQPDPKRITVIDHGDYQGTRLFIIGARGYQPSVYWSIFVDYGSCSSCDSFEATREYSDQPPTEGQVDAYWTMMLHMVQSMRLVTKGDD